MGIIRGRPSTVAALLLATAACTLGPTTPPLEEGQNPFEGRPLYMNPWSRSSTQADMWRKERPDDAKIMDEIAKQPVSLWFGDWTPDVEKEIRTETQNAHGQGALTLMVLYNIPNRDCGLYSAGGVEDGEAYRQWIGKAARGLGDSPAAVILEPDALGNLADCLDAAGQKERLDLISGAVTTLSKSGQTAVYIDAGNAKWHPPEVMAERLQKAGIANARGFALNVSNYITTEDSIAYGVAISELLGGKPFVIDTSRNGNGPTDGAQWCNPHGRAVGEPPLSKTADPRVDAYLWIKVPGESDGECNGGPAAGNWWPPMAIELARGAAWPFEAAGLPVPEPPPPPAKPAPRPGPRR
ncbi:MAG: glycoside hydrolase family 6 protein [Myxococcota bacterium]